MEMEDTEAGLVGYWKLAGDCMDYSGAGNHGKNCGADLTAAGLDGRRGRAAGFNGRGRYVEVPDSPSLRFGSTGISVSVWVRTDRARDDLSGDILSKYDPENRMGFTFGIQNHASAVNSQSNYRNLHFGLDNKLIEPSWTDCGRPGNARFVYALAVGGGDLYAGTYEAGADEVGHVYRYAGGTDWIDCGIPIACNAVRSLAFYEGKLYAGTTSHAGKGSLQPDSPNKTPGGNVYRYEGGMEWVDCGKPGGENSGSVPGLIIFNNCLYAHANGAYSSNTNGVYRYEGNEKWTYCGTPRGAWAMSSFNGNLFCVGGYGGGINTPVIAMSRYDGDTGWVPCGTLPNTVQVYAIAIYEGELYVGTWPTGTVFRWDGGEGWMDCGRLGDELEVMGMMVYNGKLYAGTLPLAQVYRYEGDGKSWTCLGRLDMTPDAAYRRAWSMAVYRGRLYCGTLPAGHIYSLEAGRNVTHDFELAFGWRHLAAVKDDDRPCRLRLYVDGEQVGTSAPFNGYEAYISNDRPLKIGFGPQDYFNGNMAELRVYNRNLTESQVAALYHQGKRG